MERRCCRAYYTLSKQTVGELCILANKNRPTAFAVSLFLLLQRVWIFTMLALLLSDRVRAY